MVPGIFSTYLATLRHANNICLKNAELKNVKGTYFLRFPNIFVFKEGERNIFGKCCFAKKREFMEFGMTFPSWMKEVREHPYMTSYIFWLFLTYLPNKYWLSTSSDDFCLITSDIFRGFLTYLSTLKSDFIYGCFEQRLKKASILCSIR